MSALRGRFMASRPLLLDEPNANLDGEGEAALLEAIRQAKERGAMVIMIAHRAGALAVCDKILLLRDGAQQAFGPRDEVLRRMAPPQTVVPKTAQAAAAPLKVVADAAAGGTR